MVKHFYTVNFIINGYFTGNIENGFEFSPYLTL